MQFDGTDAVDEVNALTPQLEQKLQTKHRVGRKLQSVDVARLLLGTGYTFKTGVNTGGRIGNVTGDLEIKPYSWLLF